MTTIKKWPVADHISLFLFTILFSGFWTGPAADQNAFFALICAVLAIVQFGGFYGAWNLRWWIKFVLVAVVIGFLWKTHLLVSSRVGLLFWYLFFFLLFPANQSRYASSIRMVVGLFSGMIVCSKLPLILGAPASVLLAIGFVGSLISSWSKMTWSRSLLWFAQRSIRKETIFILAFIGGIAALGLRQVKDYAGHESESTGLSNSIEPGSVTKLSQSGLMAMRIKFHDSPKFSPQSAYIRASVADRFLGFSWFEGPSRIVRPDLSDSRGTYRYEVAISPRYSNFSPVIDYGRFIYEATGNNVNSGRDNGMFHPLVTKDGWNYFEAESSEISNLALADEDKERLLKVPKNVRDEVLQLGRSMSSPTKSVSEFIKSFATFITKNGFIYSLAPQIPSDDLSIFLFKAKSGYCEHYASAAAALARMAGIPSRVVSGFLGGEWNPSSETLYVRDLDAHAWTELWDGPSESWVRFDPVTLLAPERIEQGATSWLRSIGANIPDELSMLQSLLFANFFMTMDSLITNVNGPGAQRVGEFFLNYGGEIAMLGVFGFTISFVMIRIRNARVNVRSPDTVEVETLERTLRPINLNRKPGETLADWMARGGYEFPNLADQFAEFALIHSRYRYSRTANTDDLRRMAEINKELKRMNLEKDLNESKNIPNGIKSS